MLQCHHTYRALVVVEAECRVVVGRINRVDVVSIVDIVTAGRDKGELPSTTTR